VWAAQGDAWLARGRLFEPFGGAVAELPGVRVAASGLDQVGRNGGDVHDPDAVRIAEVSAWFAERGVGWGLRLPADTSWSHGQRLFRQRCMALYPTAFQPAAAPAGVELRIAGSADLDLVAALDATAFRGEAGASASWMGPTLGADGFCVVVASLDGEPVATATSVVTDDWAGPAVGLFGVAVVPQARRRGIGAAVSSWLCEHAFADGARLAHLNPDTEEAARLYTRLGFAESPGFDIYTGLSTSK
jgi:GNAT superfamily N-acetyltransferase